MIADLRQGRIVWVELLDPQGQNRKARPAVILTPTPEIRETGEIVVAAITTQFENAPPEISVELPWHADGHPRTKLTRRNAVVCSWLVTIPASAIHNFGGLVPFAQMAHILEIVRAMVPNNEGATQADDANDSGN